MTQHRDRRRHHAAGRFGFARFLLGLAAVLVLAACSTRYQPMGVAETPPALTDQAIVTADGYRLPTRAWVPAGTARPTAVILALHGYNDYSNAFDGAARRLAQSGIVTYAYDQRGFGSTRDPGVWAGADTLVGDLRTATALVRARHPGVPLYLMGESMGGAVVLAALGRPGAPAVDGAILVAPAVWGRDTMGFFPRMALWLSYNLLPGMTVTAPKELNIRPSDNIEMLRALSRDPLVIKGSRVDALHGLTDLMDEALASCGRITVPALVLYGAHEEVLPPEPVERAIETFRTHPKHTVGLYPDGYHMLLRDRKGAVVIDDIAAWVRHPGTALLSGADAAVPERVAAR
ncbi:alpha-beta hydrolase superfamily lysophospholipase [Azospirillum fermentarium]|uniref:alpha/beta hydrolase n=1 Tax=Azospirillum fermentarium TaxID=1233114 RepID=UPI0022279D77|nr:alpha/beta hydrolase [Azospirillum fermentarium]MCW2245615.1 alpha-beta hydrolase superfamily lysophospholipase [Azospirillum fermentarium]